MKAFVLISLLLVSFLNTNAQTAKRLYIANDDHTDYMWTANEAKYDSAFVKMLDYYLDQIEANKNNPPDFQARFNCDGSIWLQVYQKYRTPAQFARLVVALRSGHISSPLNTVVSTYGAQPTEAVIRGMYFAGGLERQLGVRFPLAVAMENQTLPLGLSSLWAGCGAKYSWRGVCACASRLPKASFAHRRHQLYRYMGMDNSGVIMKWYSQTHNNALLGGYAEARFQYKPTQISQELAKTIDTLSALCDKPNYLYQVAAAFGYGWDDLETYVSPAFVTAAQNGTTPQRKVRVSNEADFFEDIARTYPKLPTESVSYGNEWDTYCVSMNEATAKVRRATEKLRTAEALSSIVSLKDKNFGKNLVQLRQKAYYGYGLYWEHNWTADGPIKRKERGDWQIKIQKQITEYTDSLYSQSLNALAKQIKKSENPRFFIFNPLSWTRNDVADVAYEGQFPVKVIDLSTGQEVVYQLITKNNKRFLRIKAENIPSIGYKVFEIQAKKPTNLQSAATFDGVYFKNQYYRIRLNKSGVISELYDSLANSRALVKITDSKYFNDLGTTQLDEGEPLVIENAGPVSVTLKAVSNNPILHTVRITLFSDCKKIDIENTIDENFKDLKTWAFSFDLANPTTRHEELGAILTAKKENNGGHYTIQNGRYDWLTFNHFAQMSEPNYEVVLSNQDCSFFKLGSSTPDSLWEQSAQLQALAGGQTDGEKLGIPAQNGETKFLYQFALTSRSSVSKESTAMMFALAHQNPLVTAMIMGDKGDENHTFSLLSINDPNVLLWSIKPTEEGIEKGLITRFWNFNAQPTYPVIRFSRPVHSAWQTTHLETDIDKLKLRKGKPSIVFNQHQIKTFRWLMK